MYKMASPSVLLLIYRYMSYANRSGSILVTVIVNTIALTLSKKS